MTAKQAGVARVKELLEERHITTNTAANEAGVSPSTLYSILGKKSRNPGVVTIQILCFSKILSRKSNNGRATTMIVDWLFRLISSQSRQENSGETE